MARIHPTVDGSTFSNDEMHTAIPRLRRDRFDNLTLVSQSDRPVANIELGKQPVINTTATPQSIAPAVEHNTRHKHHQILLISIAQSRISDRLQNAVSPGNQVKP